MAAPTPREVADLIAWAGSKTAAARVVGVSRTTLHAWSSPEYADAQRRSNRERKRRWRATDSEWSERERRKARERYRQKMREESDE